ncbi:MAG TPA: hypothetical protein VN046_07515, partial [Stenotrophobium sp.]|nr:hypothetical protein [Stenotrophobium sp.]
MFIPLVTGTGDLDVLDPTTAISSGTNPRVADTGLPDQNPCNSGGCTNSDTSAQSSAIFGVTINTSTGAATNIHPVLLAYIKGGKIFTLDLTSNSSTPVQ